MNLCLLYLLVKFIKILLKYISLGSTLHDFLSFQLMKLQMSNDAPVLSFCIINVDEKR